MEIQSMSVCVPSSNTNGTCINNCKFCVSKMHVNDYPNMINEKLPFYDLYLKDYIKRLEFARDNNCNTVILTGDIEPLQNKKFLTDFGLFMMIMKNPFRKIELQTSGVLLDEPYLRFLRNHVGVNTISLSLSSFDSDINAEYTQSPKKLKVDIPNICALIKKYDFNLRISLNLTDSIMNDIIHPYPLDICISDLNKVENMFILYEKYILNKLITTCKELHADQVTLRKLYAYGDNEQHNWISEHEFHGTILDGINTEIHRNHALLEKLEFGAARYDVDGISMVSDLDCMSTVAKRELKYVILRPDCKLYTKWDSKASLLF